MNPKEFKLSPVGARRLETLAVFLDALPRQAFYIGSWIDGSNSNFISHETYGALFNTSGTIKANLDPAVMHSCGATACAFGWAATIPEFRRAGLTMAAEGCGYMPKFMGLNGFGAAAKFFHLSEDWVREEESLAYSLFNPESYSEENVTPKVVARRIRKLLKNPAKYKAALSEY